MRDRWTRRACTARRPSASLRQPARPACPFSRWRDAVCSATFNYAAPEFAWHTRSPSWSPTFTNRSRMRRNCCAGSDARSRRASTDLVTTTRHGRRDHDHARLHRGVVVPDPRFLDGTVDLLAAENGGRLVGCSDAFYASPANIILPGRARNMGKAGRSAPTRRRQRLCGVRPRRGQDAHATSRSSTSYYVGNAPGWVRLSAIDARSADIDDDSAWTELLPRTAVQPDTRHRFVLDVAERRTHLRLDVYPDGGLSRLRLFGDLDEQAPVRRRAPDVVGRPAAKSPGAGRRCRRPASQITNQQGAPNVEPQPRILDHGPRHRRRSVPAPPLPWPGRWRLSRASVTALDVMESHADSMVSRRHLRRLRLRARRADRHRHCRRARRRSPQGQRPRHSCSTSAGSSRCSAEGSAANTGTTSRRHTRQALRGCAWPSPRTPRTCDD